MATLTPAQKKLEEEAAQLPRLGSGVATLAQPAPVMYADGPRPAPVVAAAPVPSGVTGLGLTPPYIADAATQPADRGVRGLGLTPPSAMPAPAAAPVPAYQRPAVPVATGTATPGMYARPAGNPAAPVAAPVVEPASMLPPTGVRGLGLTPPSAMPAPAAAPAAPGRVYARPATTVPAPLPVEPGGPVYPRPGTLQAAPGTAPAPLDPAPAQRAVYPRPYPAAAAAVPAAAAAAAAPAAVVPAPAVAPVATAEPVVPVGMGMGGARRAVPTAAPAAPATVASAPAIAQNPGAEGSQPTSVSEGAMAAPVEGRVTRLGNSFSGVNVGVNAPGTGTSTGQPTAAANAAAENLAAINRDIAFQQDRQTWRDPNAPTPSVGGATVMSYGNDITDPTGRLKASRDFGDRAALDNAIRRNNGSRSGQAAVDAALARVNLQARQTETETQVAGATAQTGMREAGDTARLGMREAGDNRRADQVNTRETRRDTLTAQQEALRMDLERQNFGLKAKGVTLDNATKARIEAVQTELMNATTPEAKKAASEKLAVLSGRAVPNSFKAVTVGGGQIIDPVTGVATTQPAGVVVVNEQTGETTTAGGTGAPRAPAGPPGMKLVGTIGGKPAYEDANGKRVVLQ